MINFSKIILHNFGSYSHVEIDLSEKGFCLVSGRNNFKKDNAISNGSGKSFIWSGICFALTGETINGLHSNLKNIYADENDDAYVILDFTANNDTYVLKRIISPASDLKILRNSVDVSGKGLRESEKKLAEFLPDLTKDFIASTIIIGQGMPNKFSSFSPSGRKELLEKLTKSDFMIEDIKNRVSTRADSLNRKLREAEDSFLVNNTQRINAQNTLNTNLAALSQMVKPNFDEEKDILNKQLESLKLKLKAAQDERVKLETENEIANKKILDATNTRANISRQLLEEYTKSTADNTKNHTELKLKINNIASEINRIKAIKDICPTCGQKLLNVEKPSTAELEVILEQTRKELQTIEDKLATAKIKNDNYKITIEADYTNDTQTADKILTTNKPRIFKLKDDENDISYHLTAEKDKLTKLTFEISNWDSRYKALKDSSEALQKTIHELDKIIQLIDIDKATIQEHLAVIKKMDTLIKRDFRGYLLTNIIKYVDKKAKDYSNIVFGTRELNVYLDGNALNISYCGKMFDNLSGGEKQRVDLILQFAIRNMLIFYLGMNSNILVLDEITDFLDKQSCTAVMKLVEQELNTIESVFIISHHAESLDIIADSTLEIEKDINGNSSVIHQ